MTKIIELEVNNILGAENIAFAPNGESVTIGGENAQGKSSAIWALISALGGAKVRPEELIKKGETEGSVVVTLEDFTVELTAKEGKAPALKVVSKDGQRYRSEQTFLSALFGNLSFDPGAFRVMKADERAQVLRELTGLDFTDLDKDYDNSYESRRIFNRDV